MMVSFAKINLESAPDTIYWDVASNSCQLLPSINVLFRYQFHSTKFGCQQGTRSIQHGRSTEGRNLTLAFQCHVNGSGELGYCKSANVFSTKIYFQATREVFTSERNLLYNTSRTVRSIDSLPLLVLIQLTYFSASVSVEDSNELEEHTPQRHSTIPSVDSSLTYMNTSTTNLTTCCQPLINTRTCKRHPRERNSESSSKSVT